MRGTGLYRQVDFEAQLDCPADVVLEVIENPRLHKCDADAPCFSSLEA